MTEDTITLIVLGVLGAVMLASQLAFRRWLAAYGVVRRRVLCPLRGTEAVVDFLIAARGPEVFRDVLGCSLRARGAPTDCGKICRSTSVASFGAVNGEASVSG